MTAERTVRDATFDVARRFGMTRIFANPGSTEISLLTDLPTGCAFRDRCPRAIEQCGEVIPPLDEKAPGHRAACIRV